MKRWLRLVLLGLIGIVVAGCLSSADHSAADMLGKPAPALSGQDIYGHPLRLSDYRGKVVLLDFWMHT